MPDTNELLLRGSSDVIVRADLEQKLASGRPLRIKFGIDPTAGKIHIGRAATMRHLKHFQDLGHEVHIVIGSFTGQIGDSSDKEVERPMLTRDQVVDNMKEYEQQLAKIFDTSAMTVHYNGDWFDAMPLSEFFKLQQMFSVAQMIERDNFANRYKAGERIGLHEFSYALLQGYDSVELKADVEIGGTDQLFNLLAGRTVQKAYAQTEQNVITYELMMGTDGRKMSTSWGNCIYVTDTPSDMYGKVMTVGDEQMANYFRLSTEVSNAELLDIEAQLTAGAKNRELKGRLAYEVTKLYHGEDAAISAEEAFTSQFQKGELPTNIVVHTLEIKEWDVAELLLAVGLIASKSEARRLLDQGGVRINQNKVDSPVVTIASGDIIQAGKRRFARIA